MTEPQNCPEDLVARAGGGHLSALERRRLEAHLARCPSCLTASMLMDDFRTPKATTPSDDIIVARMVSAVMLNTPMRRQQAPLASNVPPAFAQGPNRWRARVYANAAVVIGVIALSTAAAANLFVGNVFAPSARDKNVQLAVDVPLLIAPPTPTPALFDVPRNEVEVGKSGLGGASTNEDQPKDKVASRDSRVKRKTRKAQPLATDAAAIALALDAQSGGAEALFRLGNQARAEGRIEAAIRAYQMLQTMHPRSQQAAMSWLSLGRAQMQAQRPESALQAFDRYLHEGRHRALAPEAMMGKARALEALGRGEAASHAWAELLALHPNSTYARDAVVQGRARR